MTKNIPSQPFVLMLSRTEAKRGGPSEKRNGWEQPNARNEKYISWVTHHFKEVRYSNILHDFLTLVYSTGRDPRGCENIINVWLKAIFLHLGHAFVVFFNE